MRLQKNRWEHKTTLPLKVQKIEVTRPTWELDDYGVYETYYRTIRFTIAGGDVLEVFCAARFEDEIRLRSVKTLKSRTTSKQAKPIDKPITSTTITSAAALHATENSVRRTARRIRLASYSGGSTALVPTATGSLRSPSLLMHPSQLSMWSAIRAAVEGAASSSR
jgi:hypothetical protein